MTSRRSFFTDLASGLIVASAPRLFLPKLIKPCWKPVGPVESRYPWYQNMIGKWSFQYGEGAMAEPFYVVWDGEKWSDLTTANSDPNPKYIDCVFHVREPFPI